MSFDPVQRFLGIESSAEPSALLGIGDPPQSLPAIDEALRRRLAEVYNHPDGRTDDAEVVRRILREAASALKARLPRAAGHVQPRMIARTRQPALTDFDRSVLAILIGSGGWNATSRARLIAMAAAHSVTGAGLFKVIAGLGGYAKRGRFDMPRFAVEQARAAAPSPAAALPAGAVDDVDEDEDGGGHTWRTFKLSLLFGLISIALAALVINQLAPRAARPAEGSQVATGQAQPPPEQPPLVDDGPPADEPADEPPVVHVEWGIATFGPEQRTTFHAPTPDAAVAARRACDAAIDELENVINRINIAGAQGPAEMVYKIWEDVLGQVASAWVLVDEPLLRSIERMMIDALFASAGRADASVYERLLSKMSPPASARVAEPLDVWRGAWRAGMLARVAFHADLPTGVIEYARAQLNVALDRRAGDDARLTFTQAAAAWLSLAEPALIEQLTGGDRAFALWEMWVAAQKRLGPHERMNGAMLSGVRLILIADLALLDDEGGATPALAVVGRLLEEADFDGSRRVSEQFLALLDDEAIDSRDLWIVTSLLARSAHAGWFDESFVLTTPDANVRRRLRQDVAAAWPGRALTRASDGRRGNEVDPVAGERWLRLVERLRDEPIRLDREDALLSQVRRAAQLGEAASYLAMHTPARAERLLDEIDQASTGDPAAPRSARAQRAGRPSGTEGGWAAAYEESRRDAEERLRLLRSLRASAGGDLWPTDAAILVREAYRGAPAEIRTIAQSIIAEVFPRGPIVARELLDQLPDVQRTPPLSEFLARYTGHSLPAQRDHEWTIATRLALIEHLLLLLHGEAPLIEAIADELGGSYTKGAGALLGLEPHQSPASSAPGHGAAALFDLWREGAHAHGASRLGGELASLDRRHAARMRMAEGPIQETVALRIGTVELMAIATRGEATGPTVRAGNEGAAGAAASGGTSGGAGGFDRHIAHILDTHAREWRAAPSALLQALWVERAINAVWRVRLNVPEDLAQGSSPRRATESHGEDRRKFSHAMSSHSRVVAAGHNEHSPWFSVALRGVGVVLMPSSIEHTIENRWTARLEALDPSKPLAYFELAEEIADAERSSQMIALAKRLFALAGALDPERLGRSACLALADLEEESHIKRRYLALADLLGQRLGVTAAESAGEDSPERRAAALALTEAFSHYRQGNGTRSAQVLRRDEVAALLQSVESALPWRNAQTFINEVSVQRRRPSINDAALVRMLQVEQFLLGAGPAGSAGWATELAFSGGGGRPLIEVDPDRLDQALEADTTRPYHRDGRWVAEP